MLQFRRPKWYENYFNFDYFIIYIIKSSIVYTGKKFKKEWHFIIIYNFVSCCFLNFPRNNIPFDIFCWKLSNWSRASSSSLSTRILKYDMQRKIMQQKFHDVGAPNSNLIFSTFFESMLLHDVASDDEAPGSKLSNENDDCATLERLWLVGVKNRVKLSLKKKKMFPLQRKLDFSFIILCAVWILTKKLCKIGSEYLQMLQFARFFYRNFIRTFPKISRLFRLSVLILVSRFVFF